MELSYHFCTLSVSIKTGGEVLFHPISSNVESKRLKQQQNYYHSKKASVKCVRSGGVAGNSTKVTWKREDSMLEALEENKTEDAWQILKESSELPNSLCLSRLVAQLSNDGSAYAFRRAQTVVKRLQNEGKLHLLDCDSLGRLAMAAAKSADPYYGETIIRLMLKLGLLPHVKAWSAVVRRLGKCPHDSESAIDLFNEVCKRIKEAYEGLNDEVPVVCRPDRRAFEAILNVCESVGNVEMAHVLIGEMDLFRVSPDVSIYNAMIHTCAKAERKDMLVGVVEKMLRENVEPSSSTFHSLVGAYVGFGDMEMAERLVQAMREGRRDICSVMREPIAKIGSSRSVEVVTKEELATDCHEEVSDATLLLPRSFKPDGKLWIILMKGFMKRGRWEDAVRMLSAIETDDDSENRLDEVTYESDISSFVSLGLMDKAQKLVDEMSANKVPVNLITYNTLLSGYCKLRDIQKAEILFKDMQRAGISPDIVTYNTMIHGYSRIKDFVGALSYFNQMKEAGIAPSIFSYTVLMEAFTMNGQRKHGAELFDKMDKTQKLLDEMSANKVPVNLIFYNTLLSGYCKLRDIQKAEILFKDMQKAGISPDTITYNTLIHGYVRIGDYVGALSYFNQMKEAGVAPSIFSYTVLMEAFTMNGQRKLAAELFDKMLNDRRVKSDSIPWDRLIQSYCRAGWAEDAKRVFLQMKQHNMHPNVAIYMNLIDGFKEKGKLPEVVVLWREIKARIEAEGGQRKIKPLRPGGILLDSLLYIFFRAAYFGKAVEVIDCMEYLRIPVSKTKYKRMFGKRYSWVYQVVQAELKRTLNAKQTRELEAFGLKLGFPKINF